MSSDPVAFPGLTCCKCFNTVSFETRRKAPRDNIGWGPDGFGSCCGLDESVTTLVNVLASSGNGALALVLGLIRPESMLIVFHCALGLCWCS